MAHATGNTKKHVPVHIRADVSRLSVREKFALGELIDAVRLINSIYFLQTMQNPTVTGALFDKSKGVNFYPKGMTHKKLTKYLDQYPDERDALLSPFTVVEKNGKRLHAIPYSEYYRMFLEPISHALTQAAGFSDNETFKTFLMSRARAFKTNQYRESDINWVRVSGSSIELTIGPYESYEDKLFGVKRDIEGVLGVVLRQETERAQMYQREVGNFDAYLGLGYGYKAKTTLTPMIVMDEVIAGGHPWYGYVPMAYNLPNDADIQQEHGSKKVFIRNVMQAKVNLITKPIAERVLAKDTAALINSAVLMNFVIGHESSHGLSFRFNGNEFLAHGSSLEECKADVFGLLFLYYLMQKGLMPRNVVERSVIAHMTDGLRQIRFGVDEAHAVGVLIQYNWFICDDSMRFGEHGLEFNPSVFKRTLELLGYELYVLSQTHSPKRASEFVSAYGGVPNEVRAIIAKLDGIPVDIDPVFEV